MVIIKTSTCTVKNVSKHTPRAFYDGIDNANNIRIEPGEIKENLRLADTAIEKMIKRPDDFLVSEVKPAAPVTTRSAVPQLEREDATPRDA